MDVKQSPEKDDLMDRNYIGIYVRRSLDSNLSRFFHSGVKT